jgi:uncharacterized protein (DUF305 family)
MERAMPSARHPFQALALIAFAIVGCGTGTAQERSSTAELEALYRARTDSARSRFTEPDVQFVTGMIHHHAQALVMAAWAPTHGASQAVRALCERIVVAQTDEIALMSRWLRDNGKPVPEPNPKGMPMEMGGMVHEMLMPGMLTEQQMAELDRARGRDFDRLFLIYMIQHHEGALQMVEKLLASHGAAIDETIYKMSSDVFADQSTEIDRMQKLLAAMGG